MDDELINNFSLNLLDPESCILDCNKGEKLIIEMNNHICLGEYELARTFFKQIIEVVPAYIKYFYSIIFHRGVPDKWLLTNQIRTSANYIWILYQDYKNELSFHPHCPKVSFTQVILDSNSYDLLITTAFYNSYENLENFEINIEFLKDLRHLYNFFVCTASQKSFYVPKLRILSPDKNKKGLYLLIEECFYEPAMTLIDFSREKQFMEHMKNFILTQPLLSKRVIDMILSPEHASLRDDFKKIQEIFHAIYVDLIMLFIHSKDYKKVYDYLKFIPFNEKIPFCKAYVQLLFSVIVALSHKSEVISPQEVIQFTGFCASKLKIDYKSWHINSFKKLAYFTGQDNKDNKDNDYSPVGLREARLDHENWLLKHKIYESLLANANQDLLSTLHNIEDLFIVFQTERGENIPTFFKDYTDGLGRSETISKNLNYEELTNYILSYSKYTIIEDSHSFFWKKAIENIFWNEYLNFLRVYGEHCLGYILRQSIKNVELGKFDNAVMLLHPLNNLKLLLILFVWDKFEDDINSRKEILNLFWNSYLRLRQPDSRSFTFVPHFEDIIINLDYTINFSMWIQEKLSKQDSNKLYTRLLNSSLPLVMKDHLLEFDFKEMLKYLVERFPESNKKLQKDHFHSTMIIFSFYFYNYILKKIEDHFSNTMDNLDNALFSEKEKEEMLKILDKIILFPYRLNIMGDIFNLIFIKIKFFTEREVGVIDIGNANSYSQFLYHKKIFIEIVKFLKLVMQPLENFDYNDLNAIFSLKYLDKEIHEMIKSVAGKEMFLEDLKKIDTDYITSKSGLPYKDFLVIKSNKLKLDVDELIFRFNIVDNPWLEIIYENNEGNSFLSTILQNSKQYFQVAKKFQMWEIAELIIKFFKLPESFQNEIDLMKYFTDIKLKLKSSQDDTNFSSLINYEFLKSLLIKDYTERGKECSEEDLNFEYFKFLFDLSLTENISTSKSTVFLDKAISFLEKSCERTNSLYYHIIDRYKVFIDPNLSKDQKGECLSQMVVSTKNLGAVDITSLKNHLKIISNQQQALQNLIEKVNQPKAIDMSHEEMNKYFVEAFQTIIDSEEYYYKNLESEGASNNNQTNYLKVFLNYLINIGDIYYQARLNNNKTCSNYLRLLKMYPKEIIAKLFFKYNSESQALKIAKMTKTDLISVILEFTNYYKKSIIPYSEFNNYFNEVLAYLENISESKPINFEPLCEKEEWVKGSSKTYPLSMRILEFVYKLSYDKNENQEDYNQFVPLFVSFYRIEFDSLNDEDQVKFWSLLIDKYNNVKIFNNYIKMIFTKFFFYRTFYQKNFAFKELYRKLHAEDKKSENENIKEKYESYKKIHSKLVTDFPEMLPKTFSYIPTTNEYINKLSGKMKTYLEEKLQKKAGIRLDSNEENYNNHKFKFKDKDECSTDHLKIKFQDVQNISYKKNINFYENLCRGLLEQKQYDLALSIADTYLDETKSEVMQILINEIVSNTDDEEKLFKLLIRMKDKQKIFDYTKKYWCYWKPETTITILRLIEDEFQPQGKDEIKNMIKKLKVFYSIIKRDILPHVTLKKLEEDCLKNIENILNELMRTNSHDLCYKLLRVYNKFDQYKNTVKFSEIKLLLSTNDIHNKILALEKLSEVSENKISFCMQLIKDLNNYRNKLLVINYLLKNFQLNGVEEGELVSQKVAIKVFFLIPKVLQDKLIHLINSPELIIETLLINMRFDIVKEIFHYFPGLQNDQVIAFYAQKALSFTSFTSFNEESATYDSNLSRNEIKLENFEILNEENKVEVIENFRFKTSPDFQLFVNFMNICKDIDYISKVCFEVSNNFSRHLLLKSPHYPKLLFINFISKVLHYLKRRLENFEIISDHIYERIVKIRSKLDVYEKLVSLFIEFIYQGIDDLIDLELEKFYTEDQYKEIVRDKLIDNDYLNLAVKYCKELNIDSRRIDFKLGLFSLKNRNFVNAREGFEKILTPNLNRRRTPSVSTYISQNHQNHQNNQNNQHQSDLEHDEIVNQIIKILQGSFNLKIEEMEKIHRYLLFRLSCSIIPNEESTLKILNRYRDYTLRKLSSGKTDYSQIKLNKYMDIILLDEYLKNEKTIIINETLYYVKRYGTTTQLLNFYIDNDLLDDTVTYLINNRIPLDVFKEEVVKKCHEKKKMMYSLCLSLKKVYMSNSYAKDLIESVISFLKMNSAHEELIEVYMMLNDYLKASLEAINIIKKTVDVNVKVQYYQKAALNLNEFLSSNTGNVIQICDGEEDFQRRKVERGTLQAILKLLKFQIEILHIKKDIPYTLITDDEEERYKIVQEIISLDDKLSLAIIKEYSLKISEVFIRSTFEFITKKNFECFETLLQIIKKWNSTGLITEFKENFNELWDNILLQAISLISLDDKDSITYAREHIIPRFQNDERRMYSLYIIGEYVNSVILAYQLKNTELVEEIRAKAEQMNDRDLLNLINNLNT